jgi:hypothetical protein
MGLRFSKTEKDLEDDEALKAFFTAPEGTDPEPGSLEKVIRTGDQNLTLFAQDKARQEAFDEQKASEKATEEALLAQRAIEQNAVDEKQQEILAGSQEEIVENIDPEGTQATINLNPNDPRSRSIDDATDLLFRALKDDSDLDAIRSALEEDKVNELEARDRMKQSLKDLKARKVGVDLTPLAALVDDPNKAAILAKTLSPSFSEEEKREQILGLELKLQDRKDKFNKSRLKLRTELAKTENKKSIALAQTAVQAAHSKELRAARNEEKEIKRLDKLAQRQTKAITDSRNKFLAKSRVGDDISNIKGMMSTLDKLGPNGSNIDNPLAQSLVRFDLIRAVQPGGVITDKDLAAVSSQPDIRNRIKATWKKAVDGEQFTETDKRNMAILLSLTIKGTKKRIKQQADAEATALEKSFVTRDGMGQFKAEDLTKPGEIYHIDQFVSPDLERRVDDLSGIQERSARGEDVTKFRSDVQQMTPEQRRKRIEELEARNASK